AGPTKQQSDSHQMERTVMWGRQSCRQARSLAGFARSFPACELLPTRDHFLMLAPRSHSNSNGLTLHARGSCAVANENLRIQEMPAEGRGRIPELRKNVICDGRQGLDRT